MPPPYLKGIPQVMVLPDRSTFALAGAETRHSETNANANILNIFYLPLAFVPALIVLGIDKLSTLTRRIATKLSHANIVFIFSSRCEV